MLSVSHGLIGAYIAVSVDNAWISVPLILASHYIADAVPHWDVGTGLGNGSKSKSLAFKHEIIDLLVTGILLLLVFNSSYPLYPPESFSPQSLTPYLGAFIALLPDFLEAPRNFLQKEPRILRLLTRFHHWFHHSIPSPIAGLLPQLITVSSLTFLYFTN